MTPEPGWARRWQLTAPLAALSRPVRADWPEAAGPPAPETALAGRAIPVHLGGAAARQVDGTTCGSAVLVMLAAAGDPALAAWLETGALPAGPAGLPPELPAEPEGLDAAGRFAAAQHRVKEATARRALGPLPWPRALGTPPWTAARAARFPGVRYRVRPVDDGAAGVHGVLAAVLHATRRGLPVPLYTGGDARSGLGAAVPRHVVLAVPPPPEARHRDSAVLDVYEPSGGAVHRVPLAALVGRTRPHPALGGWTHVCVALLPVPTREPAPRCGPGPHRSDWGGRTGDRPGSGSGPCRTT
ncbi:hypothetical protein [Georgenia faecalis]|uniref:Uncharacterized protein n=1 Tax=Georgenia faecalis TaxID=2483799 RepID=A0ABV9D6F1_9MICO|nr:hypothetical protein [Georgenia faecalis]